VASKAKGKEKAKAKRGRPRIHPVKPKNEKEGRPSKYQADFCKQVIAHMAQGLSYESFAGVIEVAKSTLYEWEKQFPEFSDAKKIGDAKRLLWFEKRGQILMDKGGGNGSASAWIFAMKAQADWSETINLNTPFNFRELAPDKKAQVLAQAKRKDE
jgi:hypothetical protein